VARELREASWSYVLLSVRFRTNDVSTVSFACSTCMHCCALLCPALLMTIMKGVVRPGGMPGG
jgi:hypothetical protein